MSRLPTILFAISALGVAVFGSALVVSFLRPVLIESAMKELVRRELEKQVAERIHSLEGTRIGRIAQRIVAQNSGRIEDAKRKLAEGLPVRIAAVVAEMQTDGCECRTFVTTVATSVLTLDILARSAINDRLNGFIRTRYMHVAAALLREFRIFTGANTLVFLLLGLTTFLRRRAGLQLLVPATVLVVSAALVAAIYLFGQNWLHTIVFSDYVGLAYFFYLGVAAAFLSDVMFNRARISTEIVNAGLNVLGAAIQAVPC